MEEKPLSELLGEWKAMEQARVDLKHRTRDALRSARYANGHTQKSLAKAASISQSYLSQIENGERTPDSETLNSLATALFTTENAPYPEGGTPSGKDADQGKPDGRSDARKAREGKGRKR